MFISDLFQQKLRDLLEGEVIYPEFTKKYIEWKNNVKKMHPDVAARLKFFSKDRSHSLITAQIPGVDRSYGVFDLNTGEGQIFDVDTDLAEAILSPEVLDQVKKIQQSAASPKEKQAQIDAIIAQHSTRHRHATNPITKNPSSSFATKTDEEAVGEGLRDPKDNPCWKGYHPVGTKKKNGRTVPNCVPNANEAANPAQQAAIAIAMKKAGKKPKSEGVAEGLDSLEPFDRGVINHMQDNSWLSAERAYFRMIGLQKKRDTRPSEYEEMIQRYIDLYDKYKGQQGVAEGNKENKAKKNAYVSQIIQKKLDPSVLPSLKYGRQELKKENVEEAGQPSPSGQPRIRKYSKIRADGSKAERYEVLDYQGRRVAGQGTEGFDDLENAKSFFKRNYSQLVNPIGEEALSKKEKRKEKPVPDRPDRRMLESKKKYWCSIDKRWKDIKDGEQEKE